MFRNRKMFLFPIISSFFLTSCGVLFPDQADSPPVVLTKVTLEAPPILIDPRCPPKPTPGPKPDRHNTLSDDASNYFAALNGWAMACRDLNDAIQAILTQQDLRPSKESLRPTQ